MTRRRISTTLSGWKKRTESTRRRRMSMILSTHPPLLSPHCHYLHPHLQSYIWPHLYLHQIPQKTEDGTPTIISRRTTTSLMLPLSWERRRKIGRRMTLVMERWMKSELRHLHFHPYYHPHHYLYLHPNRETMTLLISPLPGKRRRRTRHRTKTRR